MHYRYYYMLMNVNYRLMEAKIIEISTGFKETKISKQLNDSRMTVLQVEESLKASDFLKDRPQSGRPQVISHEAIKKTFVNNPCHKMTRQSQKKKISVSTAFRDQRPNS